MGILYDLFKGLIVISILSLIHHGLSTQSTAKKASEVHKKGLTSYGSYSRLLTGSSTSWAKLKSPSK
ncbi:MAG: hypothetical protein QF441_03170 [Bacteriovoracaceae bacterium]|jgi:hypothetical protein|nr:hypothetical protein [Bacteriovoracaceae bacterium]|tara:strand:+ start:338 stop:538 length:201 start_codon:yes stop_codon:yes gene_type:complete